jgi:hypothetical protein
MTPKYPAITVPLTGTDGNAYAVLGQVLRALRRAGVSTEEQDAFVAEHSVEVCVQVVLADPHAWED